ncbi:MAG: N-acetylgalactosamine 6-sulfate sulfatase (GALNS) [Pirellula sp.]|nr:N-acetylgalactosamine 6-sulfate sulfatase (GALNS) [Pirellula sp.]
MKSPALSQLIDPLFLAAACSALLIGPAYGDEPSTSARRPNVVLIVADDLGGMDLGCYGSKFHRTPALDKLAASGVRFTDAYAACPVCSPTRAALMTGKVPARLHLTDWLPGRGDRPDQMLRRPVIRQELPLEETTLAEALKAAGYATAHIGKWHLGGEGFGPREQGFDVNIAGDHTGTPRSYFAPYRGGKKGDAAAVMPGLEEAPAGEYLTDRLTAEAEKFIEAHRAEPFFVYLPHYGVHTPLKAKAEMIATYPSWDGVPHGKQENPIYAAMLESVDASLGRIVSRLEKLGLSENTLIIFTSDNGGLATLEGPNTPATNNGPLREGKGWLYEGGIRVPLIMSGPGIARAADGKPARSDKTPVWSCDILPTVLELAGLKPAAAIDGVSLVGLLQGAAAPQREALYWHYPHYANQGGKPGGAVRAGPWKLIEFYENGRRELFDVSASVNESRNLAAEKPEVVAELAGKLDAWRKSVAAQMPTPNADYTPNPAAKDGSITLPARSAEIHGITLRYEPLPHKNTVGFWTNPDDYATWEFTVAKPGRYEVEIFQGCGKGQGGSEAKIVVAGQTLPLTVEDTGHFQNFVPRVVGTVEIDQPGRMTLELRAVRKAKAAVMDCRQITLRRVKD